VCSSDLVQRVLSFPFSYINNIRYLKEKGKLALAHNTARYQKTHNDNNRLFHSYFSSHIKVAQELVCITLKKTENYQLTIKKTWLTKTEREG
jgi:hypothetical protein